LGVRLGLAGLTEPFPGDRQSEDNCLDGLQLTSDLDEGFGILGEIGGRPLSAPASPALPTDVIPDPSVWK
jgi:hypothetical protein